jgi:hypothetical protein
MITKKHLSDLNAVENVLRSYNFPNCILLNQKNYDLFSEAHMVYVKVDHTHHLNIRQLKTKLDDLNFCQLVIEI